jgi:hypothetical protein
MVKRITAGHHGDRARGSMGNRSQQGWPSGLPLLRDVDRAAAVQHDLPALRIPSVANPAVAVPCT